MDPKRHMSKKLDDIEKALEKTLEKAGRIRRES